MESKCRIEIWYKGAIGKLKARLRCRYSLHGMVYNARGENIILALVITTKDYLYFIDVIPFVQWFSMDIRIRIPLV